MSVRGFKAGDPIQHVAESHARELEPHRDVVIPNKTVGKTSSRRKDDPFRSQEQLVRQQAEIRQKRRDAWSTLSGDKGSNFGSVQIDATKKVPAVDPTPPKPETMTGWQRLDHWHRQAGKFEEWGRENVETIGGEPNAEITPSSVEPSRRTRGGQSRRRFQLARQ